MIECPQCKEPELVGAIFCRRCGSQLILKTSETVASQKTPNVTEEENIFSNFGNKDNKPPEASQERSAQPPPDPRPPAIKIPHAETTPEVEINERVVLQVLQTGQLIPIPEEDEVTLGRASAGQPIVPDIDLTPYQGLETGVSRLHASIRIKADDVYIMDLGSANGTRLNGEKITPSTLHKLENLSVITLGKLNLKVLIKS